MIHFGLLLSAVWNSEPETFVTSALAMRDLCRQTATGDKNPALGLAAFLAAGAIEGSDKLLFIATKSLQALTYRIGQLAGASISKEGQGLIPVSGEDAKWLETYRRGSSPRF